MSVTFDADIHVERHRRELHVHCYRMLASFDEAEEAVQETLVRAWSNADQLASNANVRAWLYRIATNVCLDAIRARRRRPVRAESYAEVPWLEPYPDVLLDELDPAANPETAAVERESISLAFLTALQALPPRQRAVLIARDVHGLSAKEVAEMLGTTLPAANSALQRARETLADRTPAMPTSATDDEARLLAAFIDAHERCDARAAIAVAARDIRVTMPPAPVCIDGLAMLEPLLRRALGHDREGDWRLLPTRVNRLPAAASYLRRHGDSVFRAFKIDVLCTLGGRIVEITTFGPSNIVRLGLPLAL